VAICGRSESSLAAAEAELRAGATGEQRVAAIAADVSDPNAVAQLLSDVISQIPNLSGLVNAAGILGPTGDLDEVDLDEWIATIKVNLIGTMLLCRAILPHFRTRGYGQIVNFSGGGATSPRPRFSAYAASKAAVVRLTENLAHELEGTRIFVNAIAPGAVNTRMLEEVLEAGPGKVGEAAYREPYDRAVHAMESDIERIRALIGDNGEQHADLARVSDLVGEKMAELSEALQQRQQGGFAAAEAVVATNIGKQTMDRLRAVVGA